jgi:Ca2+-transporting ATPase
MRRSFPALLIAGLTDPARGLTQADAVDRRNQYGPNEILEKASSGWRDIVRDTARDPMVWFLVGTALLFAWLGDYAEAIILALALLPIAGMDAYLHRRTQSTTEGLSERLASHAKVMRDGAIVDIAAIDLVPGDLVMLGEGESFPADGLIVSGESLQVDESALTGEAMPVHKRAIDDLGSGDAEVSVDSIYWGSAGTRLLTGRGSLRIIYTGANTLYGQIVRSARAGSFERTPLQIAIGALVSVLVVVAIFLCIALAGIRYYQGYGLLDAILSAVTLAIAALPEEFPVVFTFFLGVGVYRLAQRQALVRRAVVVENIGRVTCICTDKTGTLTEGQLQLAHVLADAAVTDDFVVTIAASAARPNSGDPLDALLREAGAPIEGSCVSTFPFTEDRRREVAIIREPAGTLVAAAKGAPETVLAMTRLPDADRQEWIAKTRALAENGHKVIACAFRRLDDWPGGEPDRDYQMIGLLAFEDPVRDGVADAVARAQKAGIRVIMVTGDHPATAQAIARELGIGAANPCVIEGADWEQYLHRHGGDLRDIDVVARAIPAQKLELVQALQREGEIVAVTGDGVNDVPALQGADIGIAMGERGTRPAREVASIVLLDDNFRTIVRAISEGRQLFYNLKLSFAYLLMVHLPLVASAALIPLFGYPLLYLPAHIVWLELIIHPTALLVFQQLPGSGELETVNRQSRLRFFDLREWMVIACVGVLITLLVILGYDHSLGADNDVEHARSMAMVALIVAGAAVTSTLSGLRSRSAIIAVVATIGSAVVIVQLQPVAQLLHLNSLHFTDWLLAAMGGLLTGAFAGLLRLMRPTASFKKHG